MKTLIEQTIFENPSIYLTPLSYGEVLFATMSNIGKAKKKNNTSAYFHYLAYRFNSDVTERLYKFPSSLTFDKIKAKENPFEEYGRLMLSFEKSGEYRKQLTDQLKHIIDSGPTFEKYELFYQNHAASISPERTLARNHGDGICFGIMAVTFMRELGFPTRFSSMYEKDCLHVETLMTIKDYPEWIRWENKEGKVFASYDSRIKIDFDFDYETFFSFMLQDSDFLNLTVNGDY